ERYRWIRQTLVRFHYLSLSRCECGVVLRYLERVSGYSRQTLTRLVAQYRKTGKIQRRQRTVTGFQRYYTTQDAQLLAELDELHSTPCGAGAKKLCERMYRVHGDAHFERLSHISVSHLYNLRHSTGYQRQRRHFDKTRPTRSQIGVRRKPNPKGQPGYLRLDTVHQGDLDGIKGVYHINAVDEVTQFQCVFSVEHISERFMIPALKEIMVTLPFPILGFHADNGSEYINQTVAKLLNKLTIEFTKSRPRQSNDNALAESKNGSVIRKHLGYDHIPGRWAPQLNDFHRRHFNPYINFHRPCLFAVPHIDRKGRVKKRYPYEEMNTPYDKLKSLPKADTLLKPGITFEQLDAIALAISDNEAAKQMNEAKRKLFKTIFEQHKKVG
ncbi:MAG: transposase family protein, partial [Gammaproteobacteria bacterium]|nr:transposase family protein [Gammaproteobacteria bacterium]